MINVRFPFCFLITLFFSQALSAQEEFVPFFTDVSVQPCASQISKVLTQDTDIRANDLILDASSELMAKVLPEATKYLNRAQALKVIKLNTDMILRQRAKLRPGFSQQQHELTAILVNVCTLAVFAGLDPLEILDMNFENP